MADRIRVGIDCRLVELESVVVHHRQHPPPQRAEEPVDRLDDVADILRGTDVHPRVVHEDRVGPLVVGESVVDVELQHAVT